ncbi:MAG: GNAT family N-acetyltransferase [Chlamydiae bacterium]|nr:GNAT family N-acetyltransferase [Chlamydiota bacterium]
MIDDRMYMSLQKELFLESMSFIHRPGWEVLQEEGLLAFKAATSVPFMNFVYGNFSQDRYRKVKAFYQEKAFFWMLAEDAEEQDLLRQGFVGPDPTFEMEISLLTYRHLAVQGPLEVRKVGSSDEYAWWLNTAALWLALDVAQIDEFFTPWIETGRFIPFLGLYEERPAATSLAYLGHLGASLYCLGTLPEFRRLGLGTAMTNACLQIAQNSGLHRAVLHGSRMGLPMYEKVGFQLMRTWREYAYAQYPNFTELSKAAEKGI